MNAEPSLQRENELATIALDVCFRIHRLYGPGLFESVYEELFWYEFTKEIFFLKGRKEFL